LVVECTQLNINLRGRVKFPIGGTAHELLAATARRHEPVRFRRRQ
jgi:hypothetical protein